MVERNVPVIALVTLTLLAGCLSDDTATIPDSTEGSPAEGPGAGSKSSHGSADTAETPVTISRQGDQYIATKTVTYSNDFGGASSAKVSLETANGATSATAWEDGGYRVFVTMTGRGTTEQEARDRVALLRPSHTDGMTPSGLELKTKVAFPVASSGLAASIAGSYPEEPAYQVDVKSSNGAARIESLRGPTCSAKTSNGLISIVATCETMQADTSNGLISIRGKFRSITAYTTNGMIDADVESLGTGKFAFTTSNGAVEVKLDGPASVGYDVTGEVNVGRVSLDIPDSEAVGSQSAGNKHVRTIGFAQKAVQVTVTAETSTGSVEVDA